MPVSRAECNEEEDTGSMLVMPITEVRDALGPLAVQVLAARYDLSRMDYPEMLQKLMEIVSNLHQAYDDEHDRLNA